VQEALPAISQQEALTAISQQEAMPAISQHDNEIVSSSTSCYENIMLC
jgi:hypothetical protein